MFRTCFFYGDGKLAGSPSIPHEWMLFPRWVKVRKDASPRECVACLEQTKLQSTVLCAAYTVRAAACLQCELLAPCTLVAPTTDTEGALCSLHGPTQHHSCWVVCIACGEFRGWKSYRDNTSNEIACNKSMHQFTSDLQVRSFKPPTSAHMDVLHWRQDVMPSILPSGPTSPQPNQMTRAQLSQPARIDDVLPGRSEHRLRTRVIKLSPVA